MRRTINRIFAAAVSDRASAAALAALIAVIALGSLVVQNAPPGSYTTLYGPVAGTLIPALGLDDACHSRIFLAAAFLLGINLYHRAAMRGFSLAGLATVLGVGLLLFGALYGGLAGREGILPVSSGRASDIVFAGGTAFRLPFSVRLDEFTVERDGGSIANFRSSFRLAAGEAVIARGITAVNRPFRFAGYSFYQHAFDPGRPGWTALKVVVNPGSRFVLMGLALANAGILAGSIACARRIRSAGGEAA